MPDLQAKTTCLAGWHAAATATAVTILIISKMPRLPFWASVNWLNQQRLPAKAHTHTHTHLTVFSAGTSHTFADHLLARS